VSARLLLPVFDSIYVIALTAWFGSILFFSFGVVPIIFRVLDPNSAAAFVRALFPRYYAWGATAGAVALPALLGGPLTFPNELRGPLVLLQAVLIITGTLIMLYGGNSLVPAINAARDAGPAGAKRLTRLHRRSVGLNCLTLVIGLVLLVGFAARPAPTTSGLSDPSPQERARRSLESFQKRQADFEAKRKRLGR
jgi:hypothetical protein